MARYADSRAPSPGSALAKQSQIDCVRDRLPPIGVRMKVITTVISRQEPGRVTWIAQHLIDVYHAVEGTTRADPVVQRHALCLVLRRVIARKARIALERRQRATDDAQALFMCPRDELTKAHDKVVDRDRFGGREE